MTVKQLNTETKGEFYLDVNGKRLAQMTYSFAGNDKFIIDHTEVDESLKGKGVGYALVAAAVEYAKKHSYKIMPLCPFAAAVFKKKPEYQEVMF